MTTTITESAEKIRDVIRYIKRFKNAVVVIYIDDRIIDSPLFSSHISDIALMHEAGLNVLIVPGAKRRIDDVLSEAGISWKQKDGLRIADESSMPLVKMAAFDVSNKVMTALSGHGITAVIGNWVRSRSKGVINGFDYETCGEIEKISVDAVHTVLDDGFIPIFPCIGWSVNGKPYNISSIELASKTAIDLKAEKLFFLAPDATLDAKNFTLSQDFPLSPEGNIPAMNLEEVDEFLKINSDSKNPLLTLLSISVGACKNGVSRVHILNGSIDGVIPCEIFSGLGSGTMIYKNDYGGIRAMKQDDVPRVLGIMRPFIERGILLPRTEAQLSENAENYIVYELDGGIRACAALICYDENGNVVSIAENNAALPDAARTKIAQTEITQSEIAAVAVDETYSHMGIGPKMVSYLIEKARSVGSKDVFILTTQTGDWFEKLGFKIDSVENLPEARRKIWSPQRASKVFRLKL